MVLIISILIISVIFFYNFSEIEIPFPLLIFEFVQDGGTGPGLKVDKNSNGGVIIVLFIISFIMFLFWLYFVFKK